MTKNSNRWSEKMTAPTANRMKMYPDHGIGRNRGYVDADILSVLLILSRDRRSGRNALADGVGVGYGSVRSILRILDASGLIDTYQTGSMLSPLGSRFMDSCPIALVDCTLPECSVGGVQAAAMVRGPQCNVSNGMSQRDAGIMAGGLGCTTLIVGRDGGLFMPPDTDIAAEYPDSAGNIIEAVGPSEGDVIVFGEGRDAPTALRAAVSAAMVTAAPSAMRETGPDGRIDWGSGEAVG